MSVSATVIGSARPSAIRRPTTLPPGPTTGPPRLPGRTSPRKVGGLERRRITEGQWGAVIAGAHERDAQVSIDSDEPDRMRAAGVVDQAQARAAVDDAG